jgi:hypothetical protein
LCAARSAAHNKKSVAYAIENCCNHSIAISII